MCFPVLVRTMDIHFCHALEIVRISASYEKFKKPLTLKCLCFPIILSYYRNYFSDILGFLWIFA